MHINTDTLKTEVVSSGYYKFLSLPKDNLSPLSDSFPMTGKINQNFDIELMCLKIDLNYIKYQRSELHRSIILKRFGIVEWIYLSLNCSGIIKLSTNLTVFL